MSLPEGGSVSGRKCQRGIQLEVQAPVAGRLGRRGVASDTAASGRIVRHPPRISPNVRWSCTFTQPNFWSAQWKFQLPVLVIGYSICAKPISQDVEVQW